VVQAGDDDDDTQCNWTRKK